VFVLQETLDKIKSFPQQKEIIRKSGKCCEDFSYKNFVLKQTRKIFYIKKVKSSERCQGIKKFSIMLN
jgi:hypothetical protein